MIAAITACTMASDTTSAARSDASPPTVFDVAWKTMTMSTLPRALLNKPRVQHRRGHGGDGPGAQRVLRHDVAVVHQQGQVPQRPQHTTIVLAVSAL